MSELFRICCPFCFNTSLPLEYDYDQVDDLEFETLLNGSTNTTTRRLTDRGRSFWEHIAHLFGKSVKSVALPDSNVNAHIEYEYDVDFGEDVKEYTREELDGMTSSQLKPTPDPEISIPKDKTY